MRKERIPKNPVEKKRSEEYGEWFPNNHRAPTRTLKCTKETEGKGVGSVPAWELGRKSIYGIYLTIKGQ